MASTAGVPQDPIAAERPGRRKRNRMQASDSLSGSASRVEQSSRYLQLSGRRSVLSTCPRQGTPYLSRDTPNATLAGVTPEA